MNYETFRCDLSNWISSHKEEPILYHSFALSSKKDMKSDYLYVQSDVGSIPIVSVPELYSLYLEKGMEYSDLLFLADALAYGSLPQWENDVPFPISKRILTNLAGNENAANHVILELINPAMEQYRMEDVPHRVFFDLRIVYRLYADDSRHTESILLDKSLAKIIGLKERELFAAALDNTARLLHPNYEILLYDAEHKRPNMLALTCSPQSISSACLLYPQVFANLADKCDADLCILPFAKHCIFVIPTYAINSKKICGKVNQVLADYAAKENNDPLFASNYMYRRNLKQITYLV